MLITNTTLKKLYLDNLINIFKKKQIFFDISIIPDGEEYKTLSTVQKILSNLLEKKHDRTTTLIAFGGGVIGDITGFCASIYQRGVNFIQIPTTLLAQVDASIGGKTGVNHSLGKNMIGTFYQPISVIIGLNFLQSLPKKELISGMAEVIKYGIILDANFFSWLENNIKPIFMLDKKIIKYCIHKCCKFKIKIIEKDIKDKNNVRAVLNLGHTYGHAIERYVGYGNWSHGEAISVGIVMASLTSVYIQKLNFKDFKRIKKLLKNFGLPVIGPKNFLPEEYIKYMMRDKKTIAKKLNIILPHKIGKVILHTGIKKDFLLKSIEYCLLNNKN